MNKKTERLIATLQPYKGILYFLFLLFLFHFSWKIAIGGDMESTQMYLFGKDITPDWFFTACDWLTMAAAWFIQLFPNTDSLVVSYDFAYSRNIIRFPDTVSGLSIIWGCTGIKQMFIFSGIMACYFGSWKKKLWYIPMGCVILTIYNVIRVGSISLLTRGIQDWEVFKSEFDSLHDGVFRYIYYGLIFMIWVCWEEFIVRKESKKKTV